MTHILADGRWHGLHGIGRFSSEMLSRLQSADIIFTGPKPLSLKNLLWQSRLLSRGSSYRVYFTPGFNPVLRSRLPFVMTIHDLIHLQVPGSQSFLKQLFYHFFIKPSAQRAAHLVTVSSYSKACIVEWAGVPDDRITVVGSGVSAHFTPSGEVYSPGFPYILHVGNAVKPHKNIHRLLQAFAASRLDHSIKMICTGELSPALWQLIEHLKLNNRVLSHTGLSEASLAAHYRGALLVAFPSLYEGFGLPVVEGMASGTPVLTSSVTSMPEVAGDAALLIDPTKIDAICVGLERLVNDATLRHDLVQKGLQQVKQHTWENTARNVQAVLDRFM